VIRGVALACVGAMLLGCASDPPPPSSPLRRDAQAASEAGSTRFAARHFDAASRSFGRAAEIYGALDDPAAEAGALRNQAEALRRAGRPEEARSGFERALGIDRLGGNTDAQARDLAGLARCASAQGDGALAIQQAEQALALASDSGALRSSLEIDLAVYLIARGEPSDRARTVELLTSARDRAAVEGLPRVGAAANLNLGRGQLAFGAPELAGEPLLLALDEFRSLDDPEGLARTNEELGRLSLALHQPEEAQRHLEQARRGYAFLGDDAALARLDELLVESRD
jgi:tetratricopeptide (TPR) repeat protein